MSIPAGHTEAPTVISDTGAPVTIGGISFQLTDAAYDGERIFVAVHADPSDVPIQGECWSTYSEPLETSDAMLTARFGKLTVNGKALDSDINDWRVSGDGLDLYAEYLFGPKDSEAFSAELSLSLYGENAQEVDSGVIPFSLPTEAKMRIYTLDQPIPLDGVTLTSLRVKYTALRMYTDATYTIDAALGKFDRIRRENIFLELYDENGEEIDGLHGECYKLNDGAYRIHEELKLDLTPSESLTMKLLGNDSDYYGEYTLALSPND